MILTMQREMKDPGYLSSVTAWPESKRPMLTAV